MNDPVSGVLTRDRLRELAEARGFGAARDAIRQIDPLWGTKPGEKVEWVVTFTRQITEVGRATVMAATEEEATKLAGNVDSKQVRWGDDYRYPCTWDEEVESVEPKRPPVHHQAKEAGE